MMRSPSLLRSLTLRYILALTLVGCLATAAFLFLHTVIQRHESEAAVVNLAGRQRMLSQRITLAASQAVMTEDEAERQIWLAGMVSSLDLMELSQQALTQGNPSLGIPAELAGTLKAMYAAPPQEVSHQIADFLAAGRALAVAEEKGPADPAYLRIQRQSPVLLAGLDDVVGRYQAQVENRVRSLEILETAVWLTTLVVLGLEAALIFRPMIRQVRTSLEGEELRRLAAERQAVSDQRKTEALIDTIADAVVIVDEDGIIQTFSPSAERMFGWRRAEILGQSMGLLMPEPQRDHHGEILRRFLDGRSPRMAGLGLEVMGQRRDGTAFPVELAFGEWSEGDRRYLTAVVRDITQRKALEESVRRAQKMEAVGQLSGGIAHDFNNLLGIIVGNLEMMEGRAGADPRMNRCVHLAQRAAARGADLTRKLLSFSRDHGGPPQIVDINALIRSSSGLLERLQADRVNVVLDLGDDLAPVSIDPGAFEDTLLNLALNARDAMPDGGTLTIETRDDDGAAAIVRVSDTGVGIPDEMHKTIFEPFFTTKPPGKGTGLGLVTVDGFIKHSGGSIRVFSKPGQGTTFCLRIPAAKAQPPSPTDEDSAPRGGNETLLIVDDEDDLREIARHQLERLGYRCLEAKDAPSALEILKSEPRLALLITDVIMPGAFDGIELARRALELRPSLKILLSTGYAGRTVEQTHTQLPQAGLIAKPYRREELAAKVRDLLDSPSRFSRQ